MIRYEVLKLKWTGICEDIIDVDENVWNEIDNRHGARPTQALVRGSDGREFWTFTSQQFTFYDRNTGLMVQLNVNFIAMLKREKSNRTVQSCFGG